MKKNWIEEVKLKEPELFIQILQSANDGLVITDYLVEGNPIIFVNDAFEKMTGYSASEILSKNCRFLQGEDRDQKGLDVIRNAVKKGEGCRVSLRNYKKDGTLFWNELSVAPFAIEKDKSLIL